MRRTKQPIDPKHTCYGRTLPRHPLTSDTEFPLPIRNFVMSLPVPGFEVTQGNTALVVTDPQNDFLSPEGVTWGVVGESVTENKTVDNLERLFRAAKDASLPVFISPHYYYPHDHKWHFEGSLERLMHDIKMFDRPSPLDLAGFAGSGADWLERYKPYINDGETVVTSPHKVFGPQSNDLVLQLRKRGISKVLLAGMSANLCVESHLRDLLEQGFENVYQLHGGIIKYGLEAEGEDFEGKCYVFDNRIVHEINTVNPTVIAKCYVTGEPSDRMVNCANPECNIHVPMSQNGAEKYNGCCSEECMTAPKVREYDGSGYYQKDSNGYNPYKGVKR